MLRYLNRGYFLWGYFDSVSVLYCPCWDSLSWKYFVPISGIFCLGIIFSLFRGYFVSWLFCPCVCVILSHRYFIPVVVLFYSCLGDILSLFRGYFVWGIFCPCSGDILSWCYLVPVLVLFCSCLVDILSLFRVFFCFEDILSLFWG